MKILLGKPLSLLRYRAQLNQQEVADRLYISRSTYSKWETDRVEMPHSKLLLIPKIYKITIFDFFNLIKENNDIDRPNNQRLTPDMARDLANINQQIATIKSIVASRTNTLRIRLAK